MKIALGVSWNDSKKGRLLAAASLGVLLTLSSLSPAQLDSMAKTADRMVTVIVRELPGAGDAPERAVQSAGGEVTREIGIIDGFSAEIPSSALGKLSSMSLVHSVTPDSQVYLQSVATGPGFDTLGSMNTVAEYLGAETYWANGFKGQGVDVALIDSGVVPVEGLTAPGKVINGPDLSFESQDPNTRYLDTFGHGTHLAGLIAGKDTGSTTAQNDTKFMGVAPESRILSVKVANSQGATDVSQVLAAIDWVVQHRSDNGMNVRVLNLSFGTDSEQSYLTDPLTYAAEVAWRKGIVVVVAAGNSQFGDNSLNNPAYDPHVLAIGAADVGTNISSSGDDRVPDWSARGDGVRNPDMVAPGVSLVSLRAPGSKIDVDHPSARVGTRFFKGSGTSQSAALVSGAAALIISQRPTITPDQVKYILKKSADDMPHADLVAQGQGILDLAFSATTPSTTTATQPYPYGTGTGSIDASRGSVHVVDPNGNALTGEVDIFGATWNGNSWSGNSWSGNSWSGGVWNGNSWSGNSWSGNSWE